MKIKTSILCVIAGTLLNVNSTNAQSNDAPNTVVISLGHLRVFPEDIDGYYHYSIPDIEISALNKEQTYGYNDWRLPTTEELALLIANKEKIGLKDDDYMTADGDNPGFVRLVSTGKAVAEQRTAEYVQFPDLDDETSIEHPSTPTSDEQNPVAQNTIDDENEEEYLDDEEDEITLPKPKYVEAPQQTAPQKSNVSNNPNQTVVPKTVTQKVNVSKPPVQVKTVKNNNTIHYRVQLLALQSPLANCAEYFSNTYNIKNVIEERYTINGKLFYTYTLEGGSLKNAEKLRKTIIEEYGITQAWIVKYQGNKRVFAK